MMPDKDSYIQDEELAAVTDEILAGQVVSKPSQDNDFNSLVETVARLESVFSESREETIAKEYIRKAWQKDWQKIESLKGTNVKNRHRSRPNFFWFIQQRRFQFAIILAIFLLFVVAIPFLIGASPEMTASAGAIVSSKVPILVVAVLAVVVLIWGLKRK